MSAPDLTLVRRAAVVAALVLATLSRGDALVLAALLAFAAWRVPSAAALVGALVASSWRWGSTSLEALAGAQAVLGPAGLVGPPAAAAASWLAAATVVLAAPRVPASSPRVGGMGGPAGASGAPNLVVAAACGATAAGVVAGPAPGGGLWVRVLATVVATLVALLAATVGARSTRWRSALDGAALGTAVAALALVTRDAPGWTFTVDRTAVGSAVVVGVAVGGLVLVGGRTLAAMRARRA